MVHRRFPFPCTSATLKTLQKFLLRFLVGCIVVLLRRNWFRLGKLRVMCRIWRLEEIGVMKSLSNVIREFDYPCFSPTSLADIRLDGAYANNLASRLIASVLAAVKRSLKGVLGYCPTTI